jgi:hypothetical protein
METAVREMPHGSGKTGWATSTQGDHTLPGPARAGQGGVHTGLVGNMKGVYTPEIA